jgi:hypothetical protein
MKPNNGMTAANGNSSRLYLERALSLLKVSLVGMVLVLLAGTGLEAGHPDAQAMPLLIDGERLDFEILCGAIPAGRASLEVKEEATPEGDVYRIVSTARSNDVVSLFFDVNDMLVSEVDADTAYPLFFEKRLREGPFKKDEWAVYEPKGVIRTGKTEYNVEPGTRDILSALYYIRGHDLEVGDEITVRTFEDGKSYDARVRVLRRERVNTCRGDCDCLVIEPDIIEGAFAKSGGLLIWLTDDALKIPVLMKSKVAIGSFIARLVGSTHGEGV